MRGGGPDIASVLEVCWIESQEYYLKTVVGMGVEACRYDILRFSRSERTNKSA